jgi:hypothetical protein
LGNPAEETYCHPNQILWQCTVAHGLVNS